MDGLGWWIYRRRVGVLLLFAVLLLGAGWYGRGTSAELIAGGFDDPSSESSRADALLDAHFGVGAPQVVILYEHPDHEVHDPAFRERLEPALQRIRGAQSVARVTSPYGAAPDAWISQDGHAVAVSIRLLDRAGAPETHLARLRPLLRAPGLSTSIGGSLAAASEAQAAAERDLVRAEWITLPLVAVLLVVFFRGVVLAALPLLVGAFAVAAALALVRLLSQVTDVSVFAMNIVTFVGLGVAVDYSLFMTSRFRDELDAGLSPEFAVRRTLQTSGRTIAYSGAAVVVSLLALTVFPLMLLRSVAYAGGLVVVMAVICALVFLPAMLALLGHRVDRLSLHRRKVSERRAHAPRFWPRLAEAVMRAPGLVAFATTALLVVLGLPFLHVKPAVSGVSALPASSEARRVAERLTSGQFPDASHQSVLIFASLDESIWSESGLASLERYVEAVSAVRHVQDVQAVVGDEPGRSAAQLSQALASPQGASLRQRLSPLVRGNATLVRVDLNVEPTSEAAELALKALRDVQIQGVETLVTSPAARLVDLKQVLASRSPWAFAIIAVATFIVLFLAFGSIVMPIKAILMNILSLTASFGALVWVFQEGRLEGLLQFESPGTTELTVPVLMFAVVFGLAMDYELFLLSHIREAYDATGDTRASVTQGLARTGHLITRAALLLVAVMLGFLSADMLLVKELGLGMAVAVTVDATIVRALLVPSTMQLLGRYNWWAPKRLSRLWSRLHIGVDESELPASPPTR